MLISTYHIVICSNTSRLDMKEFIDRLWKGIFYTYVLWPFEKKKFFESVTRVNTQDSTVTITFLYFQVPYLGEL